MQYAPIVNEIGVLLQAANPRKLLQRRRALELFEQRLLESCCDMKVRKNRAHILIIPGDDNLVDVERVLEVFYDLDESVDTSKGDDDDGKLKCEEGVRYAEFV